MDNPGLGHVPAPDRAGALIDQVYKSLADAEEIRSSLDAMRAIFDVDLMAILARNSKVPTQILSNVISSETPRPVYERSYVSAFCAKDPILSLPANRPITMQDFMDEKAWRASEFVQEFLGPMDVFHVMGVDVQVTPERVYGLRLCRSQDAQAFTREDLTTLKDILPHFRCLVKIHDRLADAQLRGRILDAVADQMELDAVVLDGFQNVVHRSGAPCPKRRGSWAAGQSAYGTEDDPGETPDRLAASMEQGGPNGPMAVLLRHAGPSGDDMGGNPSRMVLMFRDPGAEPDLPERSLAQLYGLTAAEARVAGEFARGRTIDETAKAIRVSRNTVRAHLRGLFQKTGTSRQSELVRTLLLNAAICR